MFGQFLGEKPSYFKNIFGKYLLRKVKKEKRRLNKKSP